MFAFKKYHSTDTKFYQDSLILRNKLLRAPINKSLFDEDLTIEKNNDFYGIFFEEQLIGTLSFFTKDTGVAQLTAFAVEENFQRQGLGQKLVAFLTEDLKSRGYKKVVVDARATAKNFYEKCGFVIEKGPVLNKTLGVEDYKMVYELEK